MSRRDFFNSTVTIEQPAYADDDVGGRTLTWTAAYTGLQCCIQPRKGDERDSGGREAAHSSHIMYCEREDVAASIPGEDWRVRATDHPSDGTFNIVMVRDIDYADEFLTIDLKQVE